MNEIIGLVCFAACVLWLVLGSFIVKGLDAPTNKKQFWALLALVGPFGIIAMLVVLVGTLIKSFYEKIGE